MKIIITSMLALCIALAGCAPPLVTNEKVYPTFGFFTGDTDRSEHVCYKVSLGNVFVAIILVETIIAPVYVMGWDLFYPVRVKKDVNDKCTIDG
jgi:hypothetical protein